MPGWMTTLGPPFYVVYNPSGDNSTVCTDFTVAPGETKSFAIDNKPPPGGLGRTIGFWKNWSSCSKGNQKPVLDQTLAKAEPSGITIGILTLHGSASNPNTAPDCLKAVRLLDKSTSIPAGRWRVTQPSTRRPAARRQAEHRRGRRQLSGGGNRDQRRSDAPRLHPLQRSHTRQAERGPGDAGERSREHARPLQQQPALLSLIVAGARSPPRRVQRYLRVVDELYLVWVGTLGSEQAATTRSIVPIPRRRLTGATSIASQIVARAGRSHSTRSNTGSGRSPRNSIHAVFIRGYFLAASASSKKPASVVSRRS